MSSKVRIQVCLQRRQLSMHAMYADTFKLYCCAAAKLGAQRKACGSGPEFEQMQHCCCCFSVRQKGAFAQRSRALIC